MQQTRILAVISTKKCIRHVSHLYGTDKVNLPLMANSMEALQYSAKEKQLSVVSIPIPAIKKENDVLIKVAYSGICGTDLHIIKGEFPCNEKEPFSLGHEFSGTVADVGRSVYTLKKGDRVSVDPNRYYYKWGIN